MLNRYEVRYVVSVSVVASSEKEAAEKADAYANRYCPEPEQEVILEVYGVDPEEAEEDEFFSDLEIPDLFAEIDPAELKRQQAESAEMNRVNLEKLKAQGYNL